ncbi:MAG: restriction endonuclease subunit S [Candidatus Poribacteria bacterium]|nr:restriction endonuclease subunit S [Candidatus Poribacteria bacterium]
MKRYPEYKESGVKWIGEIPAHWKIEKIKHIATLVSEKSTPEAGTIKISPENVESKTGKILDFYSSYDSSGVKFQVGDVLFNKIRVYLNKVVFAEYDGYSLGEMVVMRPSLQSMGKYLFYFMLSSRFIEYCDSISYGAKMPRTAVDDILNAQIPITSDKEQRQIANFLDQKTGKIDELIRIKERQIELFHEQRTALINQSVTKGLDPNVEMKPSGVEWIGEIPAHWEIIKLRYLGVLQNGISKDSDSFGLGYPFLSYGDVYNNETLPLQVEELVKSTKADRERYSVLERDVFFTRTSETIEDIGISSTCMKTIENCVFSGFLIRFRNTSKILTKELSKYYFSSHLPRIFLAREVNIVTRSSLSQESLKRLPVLLPPVDEQKEIAMFLDEQTSKIDAMTKKENKQIQLLQEYRQSLISEAVTGKIDVRNEV